MGRSLRGGREERLHQIEYRIQEQGIPAYHCDCSPAMAVKHGFDVLFSESKPDLVISGINYGENLSVNITHSGTVGAALQAAAYGVPALASSVQTAFEFHRHYGELDWSAAVHFTRRFARLLLTQTLPADVDLLNLNVPSTASEKTPWRMTCLARQAYYRSSIESPSLESTIGEARLRIEIDHEILEPDSDVKALAVDRIVTLTPVSLDMTARSDRGALAKLFRQGWED